MLEINVDLVGFEVLWEFGERIIGSNLSEFEVFAINERIGSIMGLKVIGVRFLLSQGKCPGFQTILQFLLFESQESFLVFLSLYLLLFILLLGASCFLPIVNAFL